MFRDELQLCNRFLATAKLMKGFKDRGAAAWRLCKRLREKPIWHKTLGGPYGVEFLLQQLKKEMCPNAIPDIAQHIDNYLFRFQRSQHMSMGECITLDAELYGRMCQALARVGLDPESGLLESTDWVKKMYDAYQKERDCCQAVPYNWWTSNTGSRWQRGRSTDAWDSAAADASATLRVLGLPWLLRRPSKTRRATPTRVIRTHRADRSTAMPSSTRRPMWSLSPGPATGVMTRGGPRVSNLGKTERRSSHCLRFCGAGCCSTAPD